MRWLLAGSAWARLGLWGQSEATRESLVGVKGAEGRFVVQRVRTREWSEANWGRRELAGWLRTIWQTVSVLK